MQQAIPKPGLRKLFNNRFFTYVMHNHPFRGELVEVEVHVNGKQITYTYTKIRERR